MCLKLCQKSLISLLLKQTLPDVVTAPNKAAKAPIFKTESKIHTIHGLKISTVSRGENLGVLLGAVTTSRTAPLGVFLLYLNTLEIRCVRVKYV